MWLRKCVLFRWSGMSDNASQQEINAGYELIQLEVQL